MKELNRREFLGLATSKKPNQRFHLTEIELRDSYYYNK